jgi:flagellar biosynthesis chaperone FliJ
MKLAKKFQFTICLIVAGTLTAGICWLDTYRAAKRDSYVALGLARQMATQASGLAFSYKTKGEKDPFGKAIDLVNQGQDPRTVKVFPLRKLATQESESFSFQPQTGIFEYAKTLSPMEGKGIRVLVEMGERRFLGATTSFQNDSGILITFLVLFSVCMLGMGFFRNKKEKIVRNKQIKKWIIETRSLLVRLGIHVRDILKNADELMTTSSGARQTVNHLHTKIHSELTQVHTSVRELKEMDKMCDQARFTIVELWSEVKKMEGHYPEIYKKIKILAKTIENMKKTSREGAKGMTSVETQIEPWASEIDTLVQSYNHLIDLSGTLNTTVRDTSSTLLGQMKVVQTMNSEFETDQKTQTSNASSIK